METKTNNFGFTFKNSIVHQVFENLNDLSFNSATTSNIENYSISIGTHPGNVRTRNEDRIAVAHVSSCNGCNYTLAIVCDGVGGSSYGDIAASLAVTFFITELFELKNKEDLKSIASKIVRKIDDSVRDLLKGEGTTTISAILSDPEDFIAINIGDSRIFSWDNKKKQAHQISEDDTLENEFRKNNIKDLAALKIHNINNTLSQAIGEKDRSSESLEINCFSSNFFIKGIVLATDGAWKDTEGIFLSLLKQAPTSLDATRRVLATATWCGGRDNISMLAIEDANILKEITYNEAIPSGGDHWLTLWVKNTKIKISCPPLTSLDKKQNTKLKPPIKRSRNKNPKNSDIENKKTNEKINIEILIEQSEEDKSKDNGEQ